jgi:hypothetical protein
LLGNPGRQRIPRQDDIDLQPDDLGHKGGDAIGVPISIARFDQDILAFHPSQLAQPLPERIKEIRVT